MKNRLILAIASDAGGGDVNAFLDVLTSVAERGNEIHLLHEHSQTISRFVFSTAKIQSTIVRAGTSLDVRLAAWTSAYYKRGTGSTTPNPSVPRAPFKLWARQMAAALLPHARQLRPAIIMTPLFASEIGRELRRSLDIPWHLVNPSFAFGPLSKRTLAQDFGGVTRYLAEHYFVKWQADADVVLHATAPLFDSYGRSLPCGHYYIGPSECVAESRALRVSIRRPRVLVSSSTRPQYGDQSIVGKLVNELTKLPVELIITTGCALPPITPRNGCIIRRFAYSEHEYLFPSTSLCVCHGGHGTVLKAIQAGVPLVMFPRGRDQPGVSARAQLLGVVSDVLMTDELQNVGAVVMNTLNDASLATLCGGVGARLAEEARQCRDNACGVLYG